MTPNTPFYLDKSLWVTVCSALFISLNKCFGLDLNAEELVGIVLPAVTYIVGNKWKSCTLAKVEATLNR